MSIFSAEIVYATLAKEFLYWHRDSGSYPSSRDRKGNPCSPVTRSQLMNQGRIVQQKRQAGPRGGAGGRTHPMQRTVALIPVDLVASWVDVFVGRTWKSPRTGRGGAASPRATWPPNYRSRGFQERKADVEMAEWVVRLVRPGAEFGPTTSSG
ncbi:hypothetical protein EPUS_03254 [Endocarpon pusillum Z07020]|uniref:Uncharacterized protein n=1 Tax=Endocarpon pusillum (strain Z07020 / HMAS-L-300199) TaxID=1263415 RepID=U1HVX1_ENDPU|nr:uncharacterized protein EPUS_03254 [Endocarpon pusillum Z07020]ERF74870.1 hypothetical protein EPUS_03254 [Endocarpon pusillum Z07020]